MEEGSGGQERWWENPSLAPADLRQHADSWNLAADAATASLLQSISQKLVSRTHEVEGMLQKVLEETDRVSSAILNTSNSFHMLANTQFIENRTYQDDADVAKNNTTEVETKPPVTEEDVIARCRAAITAGLDIVNKNYERHEIQDSESEDEDGHDSPVPIYALIDPYENKPLPYIIGSQAFMEDNRVGLQDLSSEENSKTSITPDETESEDEPEDIESKKNRPIPAISSKVIDDESDSDLSDGSLSRPARNHVRNSTPHPPQMSSEGEDDDDDEENFFGPSVKATQKITNSEPSLTNELNKKFANSTAVSTSTSKHLDFDSESDEDGDLFGKRPGSSGGLFGGSQVVSPAQDIKKAQPIAAPGKSRTGVENVRAMPDPKKIQIPGVRRSAPVKSDLFASDSDDDADLFSSKPRSSSKSSNSSSKIVASAKTPSPAVSTAVPSTKASSGGLFSSDGDEDDDDRGLFGSKSSVSQGSKASEGERHIEETPALSKSRGPKVPVGGVSIFGSAITSALRKQQSPDSDNVSEDSDWGENQNPAVAAKKQEPENSPSAIIAKQEPPPVKISVANTSTPKSKSGGGGLFDDDDDDDDLFGSQRKKTLSPSSKPDKANTSLFPSESSGDAKKNSLGANSLGNDVVNTKTSLPPEKKPTGGLFSDDDDDLFSSVIPSEKIPVASGATQTVHDKAAVENKTNAGFLKIDNSETSKSATPAVQVPNSSKSKSNALFSSPSDDDLFSPPTVPQTVRSAALATEPPPLPTSSFGKSGDIFGSPSSDDDFFSAPKSVQSLSSKNSDDSNKAKSSDSSIVVNIKEKPPPIVSNNIFSSPSDEDDLFSAPAAGNSKKVSGQSESGSLTQTSSSDMEENNTMREKQDLIPDKPKIKSMELPDDDLFSAKNLEASGNATRTQTLPMAKPETHIKSNLFASAEEDDDDIFSSLVPKTSSRGSSVLPSADSSSTKRGSLFDNSESDDDIFATIPRDKKQNKTDTVHKENKQSKTETVQKENKPSKTETVSKDDKQSKISVAESVEAQANLIVENNEDDIFNISETQQEKQSDPLPDVGQKPQGPPPISDKDSPLSFSSEPIESLKSKVESESISNVEEDGPRKPTLKPPVGGVALFGGNELVAKISKRKSVMDADAEVSSETPKEKELIQEKEHHSKKENKNGGNDIFSLNDEDDDDDDIFSSAYQSPQKSSNLFGRTSPPPLPTDPEEKAEKATVEHNESKIVTTMGILGNNASNNQKVHEVNHSELQNKDKETKQIGIVQNKISSSGKDAAEGSTVESKDVTVSKVNDIDCKESKTEVPDEKPRKKPPVGGISMFGAGGLGGSELFAKVKQRKSMISPESESEEEVDSSVSGGSMRSKVESLVTSESKSSVETVSSPSPISPLSPLVPNFLPPKISNEETGVNFDEPVINKSTLQSINKNRVKGNRQRRLPSRAHRRGETINSSAAVEVTPASSPSGTVEAASDFVSENINKTESDKSAVSEAVQRSPGNKNKISDTQDQPDGKEILENSKKPEDEKENKSDSIKRTDDKDSDDGLFSMSKGASNKSKISGGKKSSSQSLFGGNDSDDDNDLFGATKSKSTLGASIKSTPSQSSTKTTSAKPKSASSLFGDDDDDDIFTSSSKAAKKSSSTQKKVSPAAAAAKQKSNLKPSSEPFDDPLLGSLK